MGIGDRPNQGPVQHYRSKECFEGKFTDDPRMCAGPMSNRNPPHESGVSSLRIEVVASPEIADSGVPEDKSEGSKKKRKRTFVQLEDVGTSDLTADATPVSLPHLAFVL